MAELPLAIFTTLVPFGAGAFIMLAISFFTTKFGADELKKLDKLSIAPLAVVAVGFIASFFHLASPLSAFGVFSGIGSSPLSNEIAMGIVFFVVALVYVIMAFTGKLTESSRKPFATVVAVLALVFAVFTGMAYMMQTIASWNTPLVPVEMVGFALLGAAAFGAALIAAARAQGEESHSYASAAFVLALVGFAVALVALIGHYGVLEALSSSFVAGATLAEGVTGYLVGFGVLGIAAVALLAACMKKASIGLAGAAAVLALVAIFLVRFAFYAIQLSVAL